MKIQGNTKVIGLGEIAVVQGYEKTIKTYSLGSCVAVCMFVPKLELSGMIHVVLPTKNLYGTAVGDKPIAYYADVGIPYMIKEFHKLGCKFNSDIIVKITGGAEILQTIENKIGKKNIMGVKKSLWKFRMGPVAEDLGGNYSRTVTLDTKNHQLIIESPHRETLII
jgi:chemotaxis protein CheD